MGESDSDEMLDKGLQCIFDSEFDDTGQSFSFQEQRAKRNYELLMNQ